jgi:hypothetical protein
MIDYRTTLALIAIGSLIPTYIALYLVSSLKFVHIRYIVALGLGINFWYFLDTMGDAVFLKKDQSTTSFGGDDPIGVYLHFALIAAFVGGMATLAIFDHFVRPTSKGQTSMRKLASEGMHSKALFLIPAAVAAVMGIHSLGEAWNFAVTASGASATTLTDIFGGLSPLISYPIHKFLEATIIATIYSAYVKRSDISVKTKWQIPVLGLLFALTSVIGSGIGYYYVSADTTYFFAFGVTSALYAVIRLVEPIDLNFRVGENAPSYLGPKIFVAVTFGFFLLYSAALLH